MRRCAAPCPPATRRRSPSLARSGRWPRSSAAACSTSCPCERTLRPIRQAQGRRARVSGVRLTWAWLWGFLALVLAVAGVATIAIIALSGHDGGEVALAVLLIGFPALLGVLALSVLALAAARPARGGVSSTRP